MKDYEHFELGDDYPTGHKIGVDSSLWTTAEQLIGSTVKGRSLFMNEASYAFHL